jgi:hypothetical protein
MKKHLIIHLGFPKTGTTLLQKRIFPFNPDYLYLGKHSSDEVSDSDPADRWLLTLRKDLISKQRPYFEQFEFNKLVAEQFGKEYEHHNKIFLSDESIIGRCINPGRYGLITRIGSPYAVLEKLKLLTGNDQFASVKLIFVIRNQADFLESFFAEEYPNFKDYLNVKDPNDYVDSIMSDSGYEEADALLHLSAFIQYADALFGNENILVLPYEKMVDEPERFFSDISSFMGIRNWNNIDMLHTHRENDRTVVKSNMKGKVAKSKSLVKTLSALKNTLFGNIPTGLGSKLHFLDQLKPKRIVFLDKDHRKRVIDRYSDDNKQLAKRVNYLLEFNSYFSA